MVRWKRSRDVRIGIIYDIRPRAACPLDPTCQLRKTAASLDDLICEQLNGSRQLDTDGGLQIDDKPEVGRLLDRQIDGFDALSLYGSRRIAFVQKVSTLPALGRFLGGR
jgi:hypothetical protein